MPKLFCKNMGCLKSVEYSIDLPKFCPFCGNPFENISNPGVNANTYQRPAPPTHAPQPRTNLINEDKLPWWKKQKQTQSAQPDSDTWEDTGEHVEIPRPDSNSIKIEGIGEKVTIGNIAQKNMDFGRTARDLSPESKQVHNQELKNLLESAQKAFPTPAPKVKTKVTPKPSRKKNK